MVFFFFLLLLFFWVVEVQIHVPGRLSLSFTDDQIYYQCLTSAQVVRYMTTGCCGIIVRLLGEAGDALPSWSWRKDYPRCCCCCGVCSGTKGMYIRNLSYSNDISYNSHRHTHRFQRITCYCPERFCQGNWECCLRYFYLGFSGWKNERTDKQTNKAGVALLCLDQTERERELR